MTQAPTPARPPGPAPAVAGTKALLRRLIGDGMDIAAAVDVSTCEPDGDRQVFSYEATGGRLRLRGSDPGALASGFYHYAKNHGGAQFTWDERTLDLPAPLPDAPPTRRTTELTTRYYLNFVTFSYSAAYWGWERWEREIDWMALHGINLPLMVLGHEAVLLRAFTELGLDPADAAAWIGGSAHFAWTWMGATNSWGGPLPKDWVAEHLDLARRVLARQRELGMTPVLPAFAGHVPPALAPDGTPTIEWQGWRTHLLPADSEEFARVAAAVMTAQRELLGTDHHYAVDPFIESVPPSGDPAYLRSMAQGIYAGIADSDPDAVWVLQGWPFHYQRGFWTDERARAFLDAVPARRLLLLDLWAEHAPMWERTDAMFGRRWLWCAVHNFGGRFALFGDLAGLRDGLGRARRSPGRGRLEGTGLTMEAIENNAVFYELLADLVWEPEPCEDWLARFARTRYRTGDPAAAGAWDILARTLYAPGRTRSIPSPIIARPWGPEAPFATQRLAGEFVDTSAPERQSANIDAENDPRVLGDLTDVAEAARLLIGLHPDTPATGPLGRDIVDVVGHIVAQHARLPIRAILAASARGDADGVRLAMADLREHILTLDELADQTPGSRLTTWTADARAWGADHAEADVLERDARTLLTVWGRQDSGLHDYSGRHWSGLLAGFYLPRWQLWADWLADTAERPDGAGSADVSALRQAVVAHEEAWRTATTPGTPVPADRPALPALVRDALARFPPPPGASAAVAPSNDPTGTSTATSPEKKE
ncbi:alpha-N-acetylglucosaminidase [Occultella gossypii]|uniref:Alpha-N-acetylglucosaminidase C-terminal domain-containing protein n=1 Tax=Occultella gossypii TaxID=2800820 RepID=A0ABS7S6P8_9MICO|nr:alpha-N-acetylglucosaminidase [Occultella gossypii]MBZ2194981.1 alpha-N-acetylglucosaminidase C-terminal domain-containing protein [Occultella gossypii]